MFFGSIFACLLTAGAFVLWYLQSFVTSEPNEWMLVIRNGELINYGVGLSFNKRWGDVIVKFPSKIHKVSFHAQQVTQEKQGIEITGIIIWTIYREKDGPFKAYKSLGEELCLSNPTSANTTLMELSNSIVRNRIANSTIEDILTHRDQVKNEIRNEMNKIVNGWGVWLESVEITDVKILSKALFENLQTEFREAQRQKAEIIMMNTLSELNEKKLKIDLETGKLREDNVTELQIFRANEKLKIQGETQKLYEKEQAIKKLTIDSANNLRKHHEQANTEFTDYQNDLYYQNQFDLLENKKKTELENMSYNALVAETTKLRTLDDIKRKETYDVHCRLQKKLDGDLENKIVNDMDFESLALKVLEGMYSNLPIKELKIVKMGKCGDNASDLISKMVTAYNTVKKEVE